MCAGKFKTKNKQKRGIVDSWGIFGDPANSVAKRETVSQHNFPMVALLSKCCRPTNAPSLHKCAVAMPIISPKQCAKPKMVHQTRMQYFSQKNNKMGRLLRSLIKDQKRVF